MKVEKFATSTSLDSGFCASVAQALLTQKSWKKIKKKMFCLTIYLSAFNRPKFRQGLIFQALARLMVVRNLDRYGCLFTRFWQRSMLALALSHTKTEDR